MSNLNSTLTAGATTVQGINELSSVPNKDGYFIDGAGNLMHDLIHRVPLAPHNSAEAADIASQEEQKNQGGAKMNLVANRLKINFCEATLTSYGPVMAVQGDTLRCLGIQLVCGEPYNLTDCAVEFNTIRPDGKPINSGVVIEDAERGLIRVRLTEQMLEKAGMLECQICITDSEGEHRLSTAPFNITVLPLLARIPASADTAEEKTIKLVFNVDTPEAAAQIIEAVTAINGGTLDVEDVLGDKTITFTAPEGQAATGITIDYDNGSWYRWAR